MTKRLGHKLGGGRKPMLSAVGLLALAVPIVFGVLHATQTQADSQAQNTAPVSPVYEVVSIKPDKSASGITSMRMMPDGFNATGATLKMFIQEAYGVEDNQISGAPTWVDSEKYEIQAKMDSSAFDELRKLSKDQRKAERRRMLQALLADRFKLMLHRETKELPVYALLVAKNGPKLHEAKPGDTYPNGIKGLEGIGMAGLNTLTKNMTGGYDLVGQGIPMVSLAELLSEQLHRTVLDKTGLKGNYDFTLHWTPDDSSGGKWIDGGSITDNAPPPDSSGPSIFTAIQDQLGLKLESQKGPSDILVIDHVEKPSEN